MHQAIFAIMPGRGLLSYQQKPLKSAILADDMRGAWITLKR